MRITNHAFPEEIHLFAWATASGNHPVPADVKMLNAVHDDFVFVACACRFILGAVFTDVVPICFVAHAGAVQHGFAAIFIHADDVRYLCHFYPVRFS